MGVHDMPGPSDPFLWTDTVSGPALVCQPLAPFAQHVFTSRWWPLGACTAVDVDEAWEDVARMVGLNASRLLRGRQVHGAAVVAHRAGQQTGLAQADIFVTDDSGVAAAVQTADCLPLLIADTRTGAVAAAHAGWRGLSERVPLAAVEAMEREFGSRASKLIAAVGPSIGPCCYQVGGDVQRRFTLAGFSEWDIQRWFSRSPRSSAANPSLIGLPDTSREDRWFLDLWSVAWDQLRAAGVREDRIFMAELCTASHPDAFCSYRRDGARAGRMAAAIRKFNVQS